MILYENEVRAWAQSIVDVTSDYSDGGPRVPFKGANWG